MSLVYRSIAAAPQGHDVIASTSAVLSSWLSRRGTAGARVDFSRSGAYELSGRSRATVLRHDNGDEKVTFLRLITESDKPEGVWRTSVTAVSDPGRLSAPHLWVDMTADPRAELSGAGSDRFDVAAPDAVRMLLEAVPAFDGDHPLPAEPRIVRGSDPAAVPELLAAIGDPRRRLAVVVSGTPADMTVAGWRDTMAGALSRSTGMCAGFVLDRAAQAQVDAALPHGFDVPRGGVRTFLPGVELRKSSDQLRHPRMSAHTLDDAREGGRVRSWVGLALSRSVRHNAVDSPLPPELRDVDTLLNEEEIDAFVHGDTPGSAARPAPVTPPAADPQTAETIELLRQSLADRTVESRRLNAEAKRLSTHNAEQATERERLAAELSEVTGELDTAREELHALRHELSWLRSRLQEEGMYRLARETPPPEGALRPPRTVEELLERITDGSGFPHLFFTITDHDTVRELTGHRKENLWVARAWEALLALDDYARYQLDHPGNGLSLHDYLREPPDGYRAVPVRRFASRESDHVRTRDKLSGKRVFPVPREVDPSGEVPMFAHIKLDTEYGVCPRLYFYPHLGPRTTNRVYVGYLGRHLPVQRTN
ncbi:hypothetical protein FHX37_2547 [Haloactinospora alba]|uniref:Uncharacterized protein n=1 Tax=Haloactinospora alba TaxID=405555 RepID=A0A543NL79_9ACTN|nr:hypothetical protein [Haloactinospora alba]TQN32572.1 hypothetical protein FHX37_2547 [Haloactinospora alba]